MLKKVLIIGAFLGSSVALAAPVNVSVLGGYQWSPDSTQKHQQDTLGYSQKDRGFVNTAIGTEISGLGVQLEYSQVKPRSSSFDGRKAKQETTTFVVQAPLFSLSNKTDVYSIGGVGYTNMTALSSKTESFVAVAGVGAEYKLNPTVSLLAEGRGQWVEEGNFWQPQALVGFRVNMSQVYKNVTNSH